MNETGEASETGGASEASGASGAVPDTQVSIVDVQEPSAPTEGTTEEGQAVNNGAPEKMKRVIFALPGDNFSSKFLISWTSTISKVMDTRKYENSGVGYAKRGYSKAF